MDKISAFRKEPIHRISYEIEDEDSIPGLKVKFDRSAVQPILEVGDVECIAVTGELIDGTTLGGGILFE